MDISESDHAELAELRLTGLCDVCRKGVGNGEVLRYLETLKKRKKNVTEYPVSRYRFEQSTYIIQG